MTVIDMVYPVFLLIGVMLVSAAIVAGGYRAAKAVTNRDKDFIDKPPRM